MQKQILCGALALATAIVAGCGGGSTGGDAAGIRVSVTDAPVDNAREVVLKITAVGVKPANGDERRFELASPTSVNLLEFTSGRSHVVLPERDLEPGRYEWLRLYVDDGAGNSYVAFQDGREEPIDVPSNRLHLNRGFTVSEGGITSLVVDFDLRKALVKPQGRDEYILKPVLRLVREDEVGRIQGVVSGALVTDPTVCTSQPDTGVGSYVYAFPGGATPDDYDGGADDAIVSAQVTPVGDGNYRYVLGYLLPGSYRIAFTCQGISDHPDTDDDIVFSRMADVTVTAGQITTQNLE